MTVDSVKLKRKMSGEKRIQIGPPASVGDYQISALNNPTVVARAVLQSKGNPNNCISKAEIHEDGLVVHGFKLPNEALRALLKIAGWGIQSPEDKGINL